MIGLYLARRSPVHRLPAGWKLLILFAASIGITVIAAFWQLGAAAAVVLICYALARIGPKPAWQQLRPTRYLLLIIGLFQWVFVTWQAAIMLTSKLILLIALAALLTLTTKVSDMLSAITTAMVIFRPFGLRPQRIALVLAMTIRSIPILNKIVTDVLAARKARGLGFSALALLVPVVVRSLRAADALGEALVARGADD